MILKTHPLQALQVPMGEVSLAFSCVEGRQGRPGRGTNYSNLIAEPSKNDGLVGKKEKNPATAGEIPILVSGIRINPPFLNPRIDGVYISQAPSRYPYAEK